MCVCGKGRQRLFCVLSVIVSSVLLHACVLLSLFVAVSIPPLQSKSVSPRRVLVLWGCRAATEMPTEEVDRHAPVHCDDPMCDDDVSSEHTD